MERIIEIFFAKDINIREFFDIILIIIFFIHLYFIVFNWIYLKGKKNIKINMKIENNNKIIGLKKLINISYYICKLSLIIAFISSCVLIFDLYSINIQLYSYEKTGILTPTIIKGSLVRVLSTYTYIISFFSYIIFLILVTITIYLYYRYNKKYFNTYLKFDITLLVIILICNYISTLYLT